jgi:hypothetical protein
MGTELVTETSVSLHILTPLSAEKITLNPYLFTLVKQMKFAGLFHCSEGYDGRECPVEVTERSVLVGR